MIAKDDKFYERPDVLMNIFKNKKSYLIHFDMTVKHSKAFQIKLSLKSLF
jgi:hypothetical protein